MASWFSASGFQQYASQAVALAEQYGIPVQDFLNQIAEESGFATGRTSYAGAVGIAQIVPSTGASPGYGVTPDPNPGSNVLTDLTFMAQYDAAMFNKFGNWAAAFAAYNGGPGNAYGSSQTSQYANDILNGKWNSQIQAAGGVPVGSSSTGNIGSGAVTGSGAVGGSSVGSGFEGDLPGGQGALGAGAGAYGATGLPGSGTIGAAANDPLAFIKNLFSSGSLQSFLLIILGIVLLLGAIFLFVKGQNSDNNTTIIPIPEFAP